jgi:hypothetical protein
MRPMLRMSGPHFKKTSHVCQTKSCPPAQEVLLVTGNGNQSIRVNLMSGSNNNVPNLPEAAKLFVENMLNVPSTHSRYRDASYLLELSYGKTFTGQSPVDQHSRSVVQSLPTEWRHKVAEAMSVVHSLPIELRYQVAEVFNFPTSQPPTSSPSALPVQFAARNSTTGQAAAAASKPMVPPPIPTVLLVLVPLSSQPHSSWGPASRKYSVPLQEHRFGSMVPKQQSLFLYHVVQDLITLGKNVSPIDPQQGCPPIDPEQGGTNGMASQHYLRGKSLVPQKASFSRVVDPFFECLQGCCNLDIVMFQGKHPDFKASVFKKEQQCIECKGLLENLRKS